MKNCEVRLKLRLTKGLTLVELMVTLAVLAILMALAIPELSPFIARRRAESQADALASSMRFARMEAIKRGQRIAVCPIQDAHAQSLSCSGSTANWTNGWVIFVDDDADSNISDQEPVLKVQQAFPSGSSITSNGNSKAIVFKPNGLLTLGDAGTIQITPRPNDSGENQAQTNRCVALSMTGRVSFKKPNANGTCWQQVMS